MILLQEAFGVNSLPVDWQEAPLFAIAQERKGNKNTGMQEDNLLSLSFGNIVRKDIEGTGGLLPESFDGYQIVEPGDLVMRLTDLQNDKRSLRSGLCSERGIITSAYLALEPTGLDPRYFAYLMRAYDVAKILYPLGGGLRQSIGFEDIRRLPVVVPPIEEQRRIADFLDDQVGRIDQAIELRKRQVKLLNEKMKVQIDEMVNRRLSHVGDVKSRMAWPVTEFRLLFSARKEVGRADLPTLGVSLATGVSIRSYDDGRPAASLDQSNYKVVYPNDIVMNALGKPHGSIGRSEHLGITSPAYWVLIANATLCDARFMHYLLRSETMIAEYKRLSKFLPPSQLDLSWENFRKISTPLPPLSEQIELAAACEELETELLLAGSEVSAATANWEERKRSLITAAVTGQFDVSAARPLTGSWVSATEAASVEPAPHPVGMSL